MSTDKDAVIEAIRAMRLRDKHVGFNRALVEIAGPMIHELEEALNSVISTADMQTSVNCTQALMRVLRRMYEQYFPTEIEYARKFLAQSRALGFNTENEMQKINEFQLFIEAFIPSIDQLQMQLNQQPLNRGRTLGWINEVLNTMQQSTEAFRRFDEIRKTTYSRINDVLHALSVMIDPVRAEILYKALTDEP